MWKRKIVWENFRKIEMWKINSKKKFLEKKKWEKQYKNEIALEKSAATCASFLTNLIKYIFCILFLANPM